MYYYLPSRVTAYPTQGESHQEWSEFTATELHTKSNSIAWLNRNEMSIVIKISYRYSNKELIDLGSSKRIQ